jgi:Uma2 family endonuclease
VIVSSATRAITWADLQSFPDLPNWKFELLEGSLILSPNTPGYAHQFCVSALDKLLWSVCPDEFAVAIAPFEYVPVSSSSMQPDLLIAWLSLDDQRLTQTPVLTVEVLSPSTRSYDQGRKRAAYAKHGVEHYWIIDPAGPSIQALRLVDGEYTQVARVTAGRCSK